MACLTLTWTHEERNQLDFNLLRWLPINKLEMGKWTTLRATVLITAASSGLGLEFTRQFREFGWQVIAAGRDPAQLAKLSALEGVEVHALDVTDQDSVAALKRQ